jgi:hypothetical protein
VISQKLLARLERLELAHQQPLVALHVADAVAEILNDPDVFEDAPGVASPARPGRYIGNGDGSRACA